MKIELPWPPSVNTYWRNVGGKVLISKKGRAYRKTVSELAFIGRWQPFESARLGVAIVAFPPDKRKRDLDNLPKAVFDSLQHAGVYDDDEQIDYFSIQRCAVERPGRVELLIIPVD